MGGRASFPNMGNRASHAQTENQKKILLFGSPSVGKTTLLNSIKFVNDEENMKKLSCLRVEGIRIATISSLLTLWRTGQENKDINIMKKKFLMEYVRQCKDENIKSDLSFIFKHSNSQLNYLYKIDNIKKLGECMQNIWRLDSVQKTFEKYVHKFDALPDNMDYFLNKITTIMNENYIPTNQDILKNKFTDAEFEHIIKIDDQTVKIQDIPLQFVINGWRSSLNTFASDCIVYVCALTDYRNKISLLESIKIFHEICDELQDDSKILILLLTKIDLFKQILKTEPLSVCFDAYDGINYNDAYDESFYLHHLYDHKIDYNKIHKLVLKLLEKDNMNNIIIPNDVINIVSRFVDLSGLKLDICCFEAMQYIKYELMTANAHKSRVINVYSVDATKPMDVDKIMNEIYHALIKH